MRETTSEEDFPPPGRRAVVIVNPSVTDTARMRSAVALEEITNGWSPSVWFETTVRDSGHVAALAAVAHDPAVVLVAGGDGTVRTVIEGLRSSGIPVAVVATGTANLLARNLDLMTDIQTAVNTAFTGATRSIDLGAVDLHYDDGTSATHTFVAMTGVGLDARMATDTSSALKKHIGWLAYVDPISRSVLGDDQFLIHLRLDDGPERSVLAHTMIFGNCGTLTGGMVLLPDAKPDDGFLDVVLLLPKGFWQWLRVGLRLLIGPFLRRTKGGRKIVRSFPDLIALQYGQAQTLTARFDHPQSIQLDGDSFGMVTAVTIAVLPRGLKIHVPHQ